ncbi:uncharacterized protein LOC136030072 isoform X2 [Artemia franciscana]|uniref:Uncharacterized protein n=2 Tax=Artemia franciscana TaxID=6661 RepID=A0AA88KXC7_ARTSF|nr:hypothetical protein QYM36_015907 [Artemia franciscana]KAK2705688.1 hypothetical protein QYM36_015907 [Artemia franciscana]KAK2705689.1 hypothetical protein QYM36_015907 [Artemia franciscana]KAK2705690.1 hypothetical protein QYM36_015907 [Artemia franciscana]
MSSKCESRPTVSVSAPSVNQRVLRSPSRESIVTEFSLLNLSAVGTDAKTSSLRVRDIPHRGPSPNAGRHRFLRVSGEISQAIPELWFEEENDLIKSCGALSSALGLQKSFSTSDVTQLAAMEISAAANALRPSVSDFVINCCRYDLPPGRLDATSRSCSTWVAVGDMGTATSQLPSPQGRPPGLVSTHEHDLLPMFTTADLVRSVNKTVRQNYIRRRLFTTYRALERMAQSQFDLDRLESIAANAIRLASAPSRLLKTFKPESPLVTRKGVKDPKLALTVKDVERDRGKPLSRYDRNIMIFNWLHTLDEPDLSGELCEIKQP